MHAPQESPSRPLRATVGQRVSGVPLVRVDPFVQALRVLRSAALPFASRTQPAGGLPHSLLARSVLARFQPLLWALPLALLTVTPLVLPLLGSPVGLRVALQPHPALMPLLDLERPLSVRPFSGLWGLALLAGWFLLAYRGRNVARWEPVLLLLGAALALVRLGNVWLLALALLPALTRQITLLRPRDVLAAAALLLLVSANGVAFVTTRPPAVPLDVVTTVRGAEPGTRVWAPLVWASDLARAVGSNRTVLGAGDPWAVPAEYWREYQAISLTRDDWEEVLAAHAVDLVVLDAANSQQRLAAAIRTSSAWRVLLDQDGALIAQRETP